jgi:hypothetical protein
LAGRPSPVPPAAWRERLIAPVAARFDKEWGRVVDPSLLRQSLDVLDQLGPLPQVCEQRDFAPWNVLRTPPGELGVLDWESAELDGLPLLDLVYFLSYLGFLVEGAMERGNYRAVYRSMLRQQTYAGQLRAGCLAEYMQQTGVPRSAAAPLSVLTWMLHSRSEYQRMTADAGGPPSCATLQKGIFVGLWEEELRSLG